MMTLDMKKIFIIIMMLLSISNVYAEDTTIAGWGVRGFGSSKSQLIDVTGKLMALLAIQDNEIYFSLWTTGDLKQTGPTFVISNFVLDEAEQGKNYIGFRGKVKSLGDDNQYGIIRFSISEYDEGNDYIHLNMNKEDIYVVGNLIEENMVSNFAYLTAFSAAKSRK